MSPKSSTETEREKEKGTGRGGSAIGARMKGIPRHRWRRGFLTTLPAHRCAERQANEWKRHSPPTSRQGTSSRTRLILNYCQLLGFSSISPTFFLKFDPPFMACLFFYGGAFRGRLDLAVSVEVSSGLIALFCLCACL